MNELPQIKVYRKRDFFKFYKTGLLIFLATVFIVLLITGLSKTTNNQNATTMIKDVFIIQNTPESSWDFEFVRHFTNTQLLGIGESLHASEGYLRAKTEITKHLIKHHSFLHLLIEQPDVTLNEIRDFISNKNNANIRQAIKKLYTVWQSQSFLSFFNTG